MSNAGQFSLSRSWTRLPVEGKAMSGVKVASTRRSTSVGLAIGRLQAADRRLGAQVAGGLVRQCEPPLVDPRPVDDPFGIETVASPGGRGC